ncbi:MAG: Smr/MutS family protein [Pyrinomonadaceae bacterium]
MAAVKTHAHRHAASQGTRAEETHADDPVDPFDPFPDTVAIEIRDTFDLHTINPRDVRRVVEEYLTQARAKNFPFVRIIHGKGKGVQRELVRSVLARTSFVINYADAPPEAGGRGATIARLIFDSRKNK